MIIAELFCGWFYPLDEKKNNSYLSKLGTYLTLGIQRDWRAEMKIFSRAIASENVELRHANPEGSPKLTRDQTFIIPIITRQFKRTSCASFSQTQYQNCFYWEKVVANFSTKTSLGKERSDIWHLPPSHVIIQDKWCIDQIIFGSEKVVFWVTENLP